MRRFALAALLLAALPATAAAAVLGFSGPSVGPVPVEFILFGIVLAGVGIFHHHTFRIAVTGAIVIAAYKIVASPFREGAGFGGFLTHVEHEWVILTNLFLLLMGFALLARHFEESGVPAMLPRYLPDDWKGAWILLVAVAFISSFLDNIAAALIGGAVAHTVFKGKVHVAYIAGIVAASNAGGAFSVVGDTTTTMMWIAGVSPAEVFEALLATVVAVVLLIPLAMKQQKYQPIQADPEKSATIDWVRVGVVLSILALAIIVNVVANTHFYEISNLAPFLGMAVWVAILSTAPLRKPEWKLLPENLKGTIFLLSLVLCASMMPVEKLPTASWQTAMGLGFTSAIFDNIPLTALALSQGGYDWGFLAFAVGFGGSMIWFGSSAGVALSNMYPEAKNTKQYLRHGYWVTIAYVVAYVTLLQVRGFHPGSTPRTVQTVEAPTAVEAPAVVPSTAPVAAPVAP